MKRSEKAVELHDKRYNCCQAVVCAFADKVDIDEETLFRIGEGFGAGLGCAKGHCGALSGAAMVAGLVNSDGDYDNAGKTKGSTVKLSAEMTRYFNDKVGAIRCYDIKDIGGGRPLCSCSDCVKYAAEAVEEVMGW